MIVQRATDTSSTIAVPSIESSAEQPEDRLEQLLRRQRFVAWLLSGITLIVTVVFFAMMTLAGPLLARVVLGSSITLATVTAVTIVLWYLASIAFYGVQSSRIDELRRQRSEQ